MTSNLFAHISPYVKRELEDLRLSYSADSVLAGENIQFTLISILKGGIELTSAKPFMSPNFSDYKLNVYGPVRIIKKDRKKLILSIDHDAYENPFIRFEIKCKRKPSIKKTINVRIRFDVPYLITFKGNDGYDPATSSQEDRKEILNTNIYFSMGYGNTLSHNTGKSVDGEKGPDLTIFLSLFEYDMAYEKMLKVEVRSEHQKPITRFIELNTGEAIISSIGGNGGTSQEGGKGGDGGDVILYVTEEAWPYKDQLFIRNFGGSGGPLWRPTEKGQSGPYGHPGKTTILPWDGKPID